MIICIEPFPHIIVKNYYDSKELEKVMFELEYYRVTDRLKDSDEIGGAICPKLGKLKKNKGIYLDSYYNNLDGSYIISQHQKLFNLLQDVSEHHWFFKYLDIVNSMSTLISYYENSDKYGAHVDKSLFTCVTHCFKEPQKFTGGDLFFPEYDYRIPVENNRLVLFPSQIMHEAEVVGLEDQYRGSGRYTISLFLGLSV